MSLSLCMPVTSNTLRGGALSPFVGPDEMSCARAGATRSTQESVTKQHSRFMTTPPKSFRNSCYNCCKWHTWQNSCTETRSRFPLFRLASTPVTPHNENIGFIALPPKDGPHEILPPRDRLRDCSAAWLLCRHCSATCRQIRWNQEGDKGRGEETNRRQAANDRSGAGEDHPERLPRQIPGQHHVARVPGVFRSSPWLLL